MTILFYVLNSLIWAFSSWNFETPKNLPPNLYRNRIKKQKNIFCFKMTELFLKADRSNFVPIFKDWKILRKADQEISKSLSGTQSKAVWKTLRTVLTFNWKVHLPTHLTIIKKLWSQFSFIFSLDGKHF